MINKMENINDVTMEKNYTVYMHVCPNGKRYIGITRQIPEKRWKNGNGYNYNKHFWRAIQKYEWDNFEHIIIEKNLTLDDANQMEIELIAKYRSNESDYGYNIENGGNAIGKVSDETKKKMSDIAKGRKLSDETKKKLSDIAKGHKVSDETKKKLSESIKGRKVSDETKKKLSDITKGRKVSDETKKKLSDITKGHKVSDEAKKKLSERMSGDKNLNAKKIYCNKLIFVCIRECAKYYNVNYTTMRGWLQGRNPMNTDFQKLNLRYATENDLNEYEKYDIEKHGDKASIVINLGNFIHCDNLIFNSIAECANYYGIKYPTMNAWLNGRNKMPLDFQKLNLRYATNEDLNTYPRYTPVNN